MTTFKNKKILVTGGACGIGFLMGKKALERGAKHLVIWDINEDSMLQAASKLSKKGYSVSTNVVDVSNTEDVGNTFQSVIAEIGTIDILINNAGIIVGKPFYKLTTQEIDRTIEINTLGLMYVALAALPAMIEQHSGFIVNIASAAGLTPNPGMSVYTASKYAVVGWSDSLRLELLRHHPGIKVLTVMPGYINTGMFAGVKPPLFMPFLNPDKISAKILNAVEKDKIVLRTPFMVKLTPFLRGVLPISLYDLLAGRLFKVYDSMNTFIGRNQGIK